jgi:hypothetical protein
MFARFRLATGEVNINVTNIKHFIPGSTDGTTKITFTDNTSFDVPFTCQSVRTAMKKALAPSMEEAPATPVS